MHLLTQGSGFLVEAVKFGIGGRGAGNDGRAGGRKER